jgi:hypothetical protein
MCSWVPRHTRVDQTFKIGTSPITLLGYCLETLNCEPLP